MGAFELSLNTKIIADETEAPVCFGAGILRRDLRETLRGRGPENTVRVLRDAACAGEEYRVCVTEKEIRILAGDGLGAVYGLLELSRRCLDIEPMDWWMQKEPTVREAVFVPCGEWKSPAYAVRWRGWFVNDEILFTGWHMEENAREAVWKRVFETLLRCGGNMVIAGTDRQADGDRLNRMALEAGLWLTQHHAELLGARMFSHVYPELKPSYVLHPEKFEALWRESAKKYAGEKVVWTTGFRGQGDMAFWNSDPAFDTDEKRGAFVSRMIRRQMEIVREYDSGAVFCTNLYGEMMALYREGWLDVPEDVIKIWADNGFGRMVSRRQANLNPRTDAIPGEKEPGENGIYYHVSFYDLQAANHITMLQANPEMAVRELETVLERGGRDYWLINTGCVRPHAWPLEMIRAIWKAGKCGVGEAAEAFARRYYGSADAAGLLTGYSEAAIAYGPHEDDRAGDQYYHFSLRALAHALVNGKTEAPVESLRWAADLDSYAGQVRELGWLARAGTQSWNQYQQECERTAMTLEPENAARLRDTLGCMAEIHQGGSEALADFCEAVLQCLKGNLLQAYLWTDAALRRTRQTAETMDRACHGRFAHYYDNDCFAGVRLTEQVLEGVRSWLRIRGDGPLMYGWEMTYLIPAEQRPLLQTHRTMQLTDDELCRRMQGEIPLERVREEEKEK